MIVDYFFPMGRFTMTIQAAYVIGSGYQGTVTCPQYLVIFSCMAIRTGKPKFSHVNIQGWGRI